MLVKVNQEVFGSRVVALPDLATPCTVFSQVTAFLAQSAKVPPLPRWLYVGPSLRDGLHLELDSLMIDQVLPTEELTVECVGPLPHGTGREFKDDSQQVHHRRRRHRRRTVSGGVRVRSGETLGGLPSWVAKLVTQIGHELGPYNKAVTSSPATNFV